MKSKSGLQEHKASGFFGSSFTCWEKQWVKLEPKKKPHALAADGRILWRNLNRASDAYEAAPRSLFWVPIGLNE